MNKRQIIKEYWVFEDSIGYAIYDFLDNNPDYKLAKYKIRFSNERIGAHVLVLYELKEN